MAFKYPLKQIGRPENEQRKNPNQKKNDGWKTIGVPNLFCLFLSMFRGELLKLWVLDLDPYER